MKTNPRHSSFNGPMLHPVFAGCYALGLMVSPDNLALLGRAAGRLGFFVVPLLAAAAVISIAYLKSYEKWFNLIDVPAPTAPKTRRFAGAFLAGYTLIVRMAAAVFIATGVTVSSGFVFNEVLFYWFPNFGFAFMVLAMSAGLHFLKPETRARAQFVFVGTVLAGLLVLIVAGFSEGLPRGAPYVPPGRGAALPWLFLPLLLFVGFDTGVSAGHTAATMKSVKYAIALFGGLSALWAIACLGHVAAERLLSTSIAHMIAAREILGQPGRIIMAVMVISGSFATVNALFTALSRTVRTMTEKGMLPRTRYLPRFFVLGAAAAAAVLMAGGLAGEDALEAFIKSALLLWMGGYGLLQLYLLTTMPPAGTAPPGLSKAVWTTTAAVVFGTWVTMILTDIHNVLIFKTLATVLTLSLIAGTLLKRRTTL